MTEFWKTGKGSSSRRGGQGIRRLTGAAAVLLALAQQLPAADRAAPAAAAHLSLSHERKALLLKRIEADHAYLLALYKYLHTHPELSRMEVQTAARMARELTELGFDVTTHVGGHGVVGILKNGPGPTVLVRTDMDALPVAERTGLSYASTVRTRDQAGKEMEAMHACGHDLHMT